MLKLTFTLLSFLFAVTSLTGQEKEIEKKLNELLSKQFKPGNPGCVVLVAKDGRVIYKKAFGMANLELIVPVTENMVFNIASITKQYTAVAILRLAEQKRLSLRDSLQKFVPDFPFKGHTITIEHLLTHTSGIKDYLQIDYPALYMERWDFSPGQLIDSFKHQNLLFDPGSKFTYSNSGYYLLGYIIEKITGLSYQQYLQDSILKPLDLTHTYFDRNDEIIPNRVTGYRKEGERIKNIGYWSPTIEYAAGGLISNVDDLFKWHQGIYKYKILQKGSLEKAFIPYQLNDGTKSNYGYGWFLKTRNGVSSIEHQGGLPGFLSNEVYYPAEDVYVAILCNSSSVSIDAITADISSIALGKPLQANVMVDSKDLDKYVGSYQLTADKERIATITKKDGGLVAEITNAGTFPLLFQSGTKFQFKGLADVNCEFIVENGKVTKFEVKQNGDFEWLKIK